MITQVVLFDGFDPLDAIAPYEVLTAGGLQVRFAAAEGARTVPSGTTGISLAALDPGPADLVIVPGAAGTTDEIPALLAAALNTPLPKMLNSAFSGTVAAVCGGSLLLAMAGLITGRTATTHHMGMDALAACGVTAVDTRVVDDGNLITAGGVTSGLDLGLYLLERFISPQAAIDVGKYFEHERRGTVWAA
ncbi:DJ-1/PfpI family protein [Kibdelosporangium lantanae]